MSGGRDAGRLGEDLALRHLVQEGYELLARNYRTRRGEIDLIVRRGATLVFVEVKLRRGVGFGEPLESITPRKQERIRSAASHYLSGLPEDEFEEVRFDAIGVLVRRGRASVTHLKDAF
ncbi:MAG: YraN family protein [Rubrobacteraceae bacterium]|nr:YraN family protein [Rubrobacteraceae bacterium]